MDPETLRAACGGDRAALERLVSEYELSIRLYAARLVPGHEQADDLAQEAFLSAFSSLDRFDPNRDFGLWLRGIVRNLALREWQRMARAKVKMEDLAAHVELLSGEAREDDSEQDRRVSVLRQCIEGLPRKSAQLLQMVYDLGFTHAQIARQIRTSLDAVKQAVSRLRFKLKECLERRLAETEA